MPPTWCPLSRVSLAPPTAVLNGVEKASYFIFLHQFLDFGGATATRS
jgi:hypothetical protein